MLGLCGDYGSSLIVCAVVEAQAHAAAHWHIHAAGKRHSRSVLVSSVQEERLHKGDLYRNGYLHLPAQGLVLHSLAVGEQLDVVCRQTVGSGKVELYPAVFVCNEERLPGHCGVEVLPNLHIVKRRGLRLHGRLFIHHHCFHGILYHSPRLGNRTGSLVEHRRGIVIQYDVTPLRAVEAAHMTVRHHGLGTAERI